MTAYEHFSTSTRTALLAGCSVLALVSTFSSPARAVAFHADGTATVDSGGAQQTQSQTADAVDAPVDVLKGPSTANANSLFHAYGGPSGLFGARSSGGGNHWDVNSHYSSNQVITNGNATATAFELHFHVDNGEVGTFASSFASGTDALFAEFDIHIKLNGSDVASTDVKVTDLGVPVLTGSFDLGGTASGSNYSWSGGDFVVSLGTFAPGESKTLLYVMDALASGTVDGCSIGGGGGGSGIFTAAVVGGSGTSCGSIARSGDPNGVDGDPRSATVPTGTADFFVAEVPEPATLALLTVGLAGLAATRRRRRSDADAIC